jgi:hypothetical protein
MISKGLLKTALRWVSLRSGENEMEEAHSNKNFCLDKTVVLLQNLNACVDEATAASNSSAVVSGTLVSTVCVDYGDRLPKR